MQERQYPLITEWQKFTGNTRQIVTHGAVYSSFLESFVAENLFGFDYGKTTCYSVILDCES